MSDQPKNNLTECSDCGAAVLNAEAHKRWHTSVIDEKKLGKAFGEMATLTEHGRRL